MVYKKRETNWHVLNKRPDLDRKESTDKKITKHIPQIQLRIAKFSENVINLRFLVCIRKNQKKNSFEFSNYRRTLIIFGGVQVDFRYYYPFSWESTRERILVFNSSKLTRTLSRQKNNKSRKLPNRVQPSMWSQSLTEREKPRVSYCVQFSHCNWFEMWSTNHMLSHVNSVSFGFLP